MKLFRVLLLWLSVTAMICAALASQEPRGSSVAEQTWFTESQPIEHRATLSPAIVELLLQTKQGKWGPASVTAAARQNPSELFEASVVHLAGRNETDFVVRGVGRMNGADHVSHWVVGSYQSGPAVLLFCGVDSIKVMDTRTLGYKDIRCEWSSPQDTKTTDYHFDGKTYRVAKRSHFRTYQ